MKFATESKPASVPPVGRELVVVDGKPVARVHGCFKVAREASNDKTTARFSVTSETPCMDYVYVNDQWQRALVVLGHNPAEVDLSRMDKGMNLRDGHGGDQVAKLHNVTIRDGKLCGDSISWGASERAQVLRADYESGVRDDVSVEADYQPAALSIIGEKDGVPLVRCCRWVPLAAALGVVTPADPNVGLNRSAQPPSEKPVETKPPETPAIISRSKNMPKTPEELAAEQAAEQKKIERARISEVYALCRHFNVPDAETEKYVNDETPIADVQRAVIAKYAAPKAQADANRVAAPARAQEVVGQEGHGRTYSVARAVMAAAMDRIPGFVLPSGVDVGFERECSQQCNRVFGATNAFRIPWDAPLGTVNRAFAITAPGTGSYAVSQTLRPDLWIDYLYAKLILPQLGVTMLPGCVGDILLPKQTGSATGYWVDETTGATVSTPALGQVKGTPHQCGGYTEITRQMLLQSAVAADAIVTNSLVSTLARTIQTAAFHGTGSNNQPVGLFTALNAGYQGQAAITASTITTPGTFAELEAMKATPEEANVDGEFKFAMRPTAFRKLKSVARGTSVYVPVAVEEGGRKFVADNPTETTSALTAGYGAYGKFDTMAVALWGSTDIIVNPYALDTAGGLRITALQNVDVLHRYLTAFAWSTTFGS